MVWYVLPKQGQPQTAKTASHLQQQITTYLLTTPFAAEAGRLVGEQLAQQFRFSSEKLGYLQQLLAEQLFLGLDETQTAWLAPRLAAFWAQMTVGYGYRLRKLHLNEQANLPEKLLKELHRAAEGEQRFMSLFNATYSPVVLHEYGRILAVNKAITHILGYTAAELVGQQIQALVGTMAPLAEQDTIRKHSAQGGHYSYQTRCFSKSGTEIPIQVTVSQILYEGRPLRLIVLQPLTPAFRPAPELDKVNLTPRQQEVLYHLAAGLSNPQIAETLGISLTTVKRHNQEIFAKLQVTTRVEAAVWAWQKLDSFIALSHDE